MGNILVSKYWGNKTVFHTIDFYPRGIFMSKCDINYFEITLPRHSCLLANLSIIVEDCSWYSFVVMMIFTYDDI